jgi:hypothetical protein
MPNEVIFGLLTPSTSSEEPLDIPIGETISTAGPSSGNNSVISNDLDNIMPAFRERAPAGCEFASWLPAVRVDVFEAPNASWLVVPGPLSTPPLLCNAGD